MEEARASREARSAELARSRWVVRYDERGRPRYTKREADPAVERQRRRRALGDLGEGPQQTTGRINTSGRPVTHARSPEPDPDWAPAEPREPGKLRGKLWGLRSAIRDIQAPRSKNCGWASINGGDVAVTASDEGACVVEGVQTCGSVWACPCCAARIKTGRAKQIHTLMTEHGHDRAAMLTLTIRHGFGDSLRKMRQALGKCWRRFTRGAPYRRKAEALGIVGHVRAMEVTHGPNGWHPHLHVLLLLDRDLPRDECFEEDGTWKWYPKGAEFYWIADRWQRFVAEELGEKFRPNLEHGAVLTPCHRARYLSKLGLEMSDPGYKKGRRPGHRTPWEIAHDWAKMRGKADAELWRRYCEDMKGARHLTWSRGLKDEHGIEERSDQELAEEEQSDPTRKVIARLSADEWVWLRRRWFEGLPGPLHVCMVAEQHGAAGLRDELARLFPQRRERPWMGQNSSRSP